MRAIVVGVVSGLLSASAVAADRATTRPFATVTAHRLDPAEEAPVQLKGGDGIYVVEGRVVDVSTGAVMSRPRLYVRPGVTATIEIGAEDRDGLTMTVRVDETERYVDATTELRHGGEVVGHSTSRSVIAPTSPAVIAPS